MLDKGKKRKTHLFFFDLSVLSIAVDKDPQFPDNDGVQQGYPAPDSLPKGDGKVRTKSARVRQRVRKAGPGLLRETKLGSLYLYLSKDILIHARCDPCQRDGIPVPSVGDWCRLLIRRWRRSQ